MGIMDIEAYKKEVAKQLKFEEDLISVIQKQKLDNSSLIIKRIEARKAILNTELTQDVENAPEEIKPEPQKQQEEKKEVPQQPPPKKKGPEYVKDKKLYENLKQRLEEYKNASHYFSNIVYLYNYRSEIQPRQLMQIIKVQNCMKP